MRYRLTPLHFLAAYFIYRAVYYLRTLEPGGADIGELMGYILVGFTIMSLLLDLVLQSFFHKNKKVLYTTESILVAGVIGYHVYNFGFTHF